MIATEVNLEDITRLFIRFSIIVGKKFWQDRVKLLKQEIKGHSHLEDLLVQQNNIAFKLLDLSQQIEKYGHIRKKLRHNLDYYPTYTFIVQFLSVYDGFPAEKKNLILRRVQTSFKNPDELRSLIVEFSAATHFAARGYSVSWPEMEGDGNIDLVIDDFGENGLEVECKAVSSQTGRKISSREAAHLFSICRPIVTNSIYPEVGGLAIVITVNGDYLKYLDNLRSSLEIFLMNGEVIETETYSISASRFDLSELDGFKFTNNNPQLREVIDKVSSTENCESMLVGNSKRAVLLVIRHESTDTTLMKIYSTIKGSAKKQPSKKRPVLYVVGFEDITGEQLLSVASQDQDESLSPTGIRLVTSRFLDSPERQHVVGVAYISTTNYDSSNPEITSASGRAYYFANRQSVFWDYRMEQLFQSKVGI